MSTMNSSIENSVGKKDKQQIASMKAKKLSLKKRKACIKKKTMEISVLCDIEACVVIVDDNGEIETWPENQSAVMKIITRYKNCIRADTGGDDNKDEEFGCSDQDQNMVLNLSSWDDHLFDGLPLGSLQEVLGAIDTKIEAVGRRIQVLNNLVDYDQINNKGKEIVVFGTETSEQNNIIQTPTTFPDSMCLSGGDYLNQPFIEAQNFGWFNDGSNFCFNNQIVPSFGEPSEQGFSNMMSGQQPMQTPYCFGQGSDQILFNMEAGMHPPPQVTTRGLFPGQTNFGIWQNPTGFS